MGQSYTVINLDKNQKLDPRAFDDGRKLEELACSSCGTMTALALLLAVGNGRGNGDCDEAADPDHLIGSWAGDRVAIVGEYAKPGEIGVDVRSAGPTDISEAIFAVMMLAGWRIDDDTADAG